MHVHGEASCTGKGEHRTLVVVSLSKPMQKFSYADVVVVAIKEPKSCMAYNASWPETTFTPSEAIRLATLLCQAANKIIDESDKRQ